ncbi:putative GTP-ase activating protein [Oesophagostomum dentatum]|uniref:Putative GTP-ase activating protein n=1 Tax=Oesophagostomum dentatum TaxID=61180 RepID=A0A0B1THG0_OESDE|nr:putative GTP-ase activating protein [Oesophagostomum dentatum]
MVNTPHVSSSGSTLSAQKKRQDEKNLRTLRELSSLPANRFCFECGQRGPTYVNVTHGSFCCTTCSGILRGLNPPHRVKSISMANFTNEEIERVRNLGNEENSHIWLGLYSGNPPKMTNKDEITAFLIKKYEKKEWYVSRSELEEQERLLNQAKEVASQCGTSVKSSGSSSSKPPDLDLLAADPFAAFGPPITRPPAVQPFAETTQPSRQAASSAPAQPFSPPAFTAPPPPLPSKSPTQGGSLTSQVTDPFAPGAAKVCTSDFDLFADFDAKFSELALKNSSTVDTFGSPLPPQPLPKSATVSASLHTHQPPSVQPTNPFPVEASSAPAQPFSPPAFTAPPPPLPSKSPTQGGSLTSQVTDPFAPGAAKVCTSDFDLFADFDAKFSELALKNSSTVDTFGSPLPPQPLPKSATVSASLHTHQPPSVQPTNPFPVERPAVAPSFGVPTTSAPPNSSSTSNDADKYSALAELDQLFHHGSSPGMPGQEKPAWLPSGFSTGLPPSHYAHGFGDVTQAKVPAAPYGSLPKSNTLGAIAEVGTAPAPPTLASFDSIQHQPFSNSFANLAPNPFLSQPFAAPCVPQATSMPVNGPRHIQPANIAWNNPFSASVAKTISKVLIAIID